MNEVPKGLAKVSWHDPETGQIREFVLTEGATVTIGRSREAEISIPDQHVSRQHAVITHQYGVFMISDLGSANGTFVNDQQLTDPFPLAHGDKIRLFVPIIEFSANVTDEEHTAAFESGTLIVAADVNAVPRLTITSGQQEGMEFPVLTSSISIGRDVASATWDIRLADRAVSRPHAIIEKQGNQWMLVDQGSANGTIVNGQFVTAPVELADGHVIVMGETTLLFRLSGGK